MEDNSTKAIVNTLEHSSPSVVHSFLGRFSPPVLQLDGSEAAEFHLQRATEAARSEPRALLGISILGKVDPATFEPDSAEGGSRVDAAIRVPRRGTLLVEVKTVDQLDGSQLNRHARYWGLPEAKIVEGALKLPASWALQTWADLWRWTREQGSDPQLDAVSKFLLNQLAEYLDLQGFAPWAGFSEADFEAFAVEAPELRVTLQNKMAGLWEHVLEELTPEERQALGTIHAGRIGRTRDPAWAQTNRDEPGANLTVELNDRELQLNLVGWTAHQSRAVAQWIASRKLDELSSTVELVAWERSAKRARSGKPFWMGAPGRELRRFTVADIASGAFDSWQRNWEATERTDFTRLAYHLRRTWSRAEVVALGEQLPAELVDDVRAFLRPLAAINRRPHP